MQTVREDLVGEFVVAEGPTVPARLEKHDRVPHGQRTQEQHDQQQCEVEVVGPVTEGVIHLQEKKSQIPGQRHPRRL